MQASAAPFCVNLSDSERERLFSIGVRDAILHICRMAVIMRCPINNTIRGDKQIMEIRKATIKDLDAITAVEAECFPAAEAADRNTFARRLAVYPDHFWLLYDGETLVGFVNGMVTDEPDLTDEMYEKAEMHKPDGKWQMIFGVNTIPSYRRRGCAARLLEQAIQDAKEQGREGLVLTCKDKLVHYYAKFGFVSEGVSESVHGGVVWYQMRLKFA